MAIIQPLGVVGINCDGSKSDGYYFRGTRGDLAHEQPKNGTDFLCGIICKMFAGFSDLSGNVLSKPIRCDLMPAIYDGRDDAGAGLAATTLARG